MIIPPFDPSTIPEKFHMGMYTAPILGRSVFVVVCIPCTPTDQYPGFVSLFQDFDQAESALNTWRKTFDSCHCAKSETLGELALAAVAPR